MQQIRQVLKRKQPNSQNWPRKSNCLSRRRRSCEKSLRCWPKLSEEDGSLLVEVEDEAAPSAPSAQTASASSKQLRRSHSARSGQTGCAPLALRTRSPCARISLYELFCTSCVRRSRSSRYSCSGALELRIGSALLHLRRSYSRTNGAELRRQSSWTSRILSRPR